MTRRELIDLCLTFSDAYEDYPFDDFPDDPAAWTVMRHVSNKKSFALIYDRGGLQINLKCEPLRADLLRQLYEGVTPAYHMNKMHWNTVVPGSDVGADELYGMIEHSYDLTAPKRKAKK